MIGFTFPVVPVGKYYREPNRSTTPPELKTKINTIYALSSKCSSLCIISKAFVSVHNNNGLIICQIITSAFALQHYMHANGTYLW